MSKLIKLLILILIDQTQIFVSVPQYILIVLKTFIANIENILAI